MKTKETSEPIETVREPEEQVSVYIPSEGTGAFLEGALNGKTFRIPTDTVVTVPRRIARVIAESRKELLEGSRAAEAFAGVGGRKIG